MMNKYIGTILLLDKAETLLVIKPLYGTIRHSDTPPFHDFHVPNLRLCHFREMDLTLRRKNARHKGQAFMN
jgi:hypothetical protein